ncbi:MAG: S8 family serine peptidase [Pseudomonadota bacterium]|nr:S8 family serine peptidase [Pseudomonadota bacterium]
MKTATIIAASLAIAAAGATSALAGEGRYVLMLKGNSVPSDLAAKVEAAGGSLVRTLPQVNIAIAVSSNPNFAASAKGIGAVQDAGLVGATKAPDSMIAAEPELEAPTPADDLYNAGMVWGVNRIHAPDAWANGHTGSHNTVVAVIDTGVAYNHPDLAPNMVLATCVTSQPTCNPYPSLSFHGTHVAGTVAAAFGAGRVVGVAPNTGIASYNTFENIPDCGVCSYSDSRWVAMLDAADRGYKVISMSLGGYVAVGGQGSNETTAYLQAEKKIAKYVSQHGTLMVASSGNDGVDLNGPLSHVPGDIPEMVNVGATGIQPIPRYPVVGNFDIRAFYSNFGAAVDIAAPGGDCGEIDDCNGLTINGFPYFNFYVLSTYVVPSPACAAVASCPLGYAWSAGTSMATPHVSGVAALIFDANPGIKPHQVKALLKSSAENIGSRQEFGAGLVRADKATQ